MRDKTHRFIIFMKRTILFLSILVSIFWVSTRFINAYKYALVGVVFEILWLPMILLIFCLPVISLYFLLKEKFSFKSAYFFAMLIMTFTFLFIYYLT